MRAFLVASILVLWCSASAGAGAADGPSWFCFPIGSTGFKWTNGAWRSVDFEIGAKKYVLAQRDGGSDYSIAEVGTAISSSCTGVGDGTAMHCRSFVEEWRINLLSLRYLRVYMFGFWGGEDSDSDTPLVEIGKCSKI